MEGNNYMYEHKLVVIHRRWGRRDNGVRGDEIRREGQEEEEKEEEEEEEPPR